MQKQKKQQIKKVKKQKKKSQKKNLTLKQLQGKCKRQKIRLALATALGAGMICCLCFWQLYETSNHEKLCTQIAQLEKELNNIRNENDDREFIYKTYYTPEEIMEYARSYGMIPQWEGENKIIYYQSHNEE